MGTLSLDQLREAVRSGAAARCRVVLQPAGGEGTKVFPPTYAGSVYAVEKRRLPEFPEPVDCVLLDSVQSQANRMEEALQQAIDDGTFQRAGISIPLIEVDFTPFWDPDGANSALTDETRLLEPVGRVSSLLAPHRIADAILRDSVVDEDGPDKGKPFRAKNESLESSIGQLLRRVSLVNATPLYEHCPTALLFGMWDSTGPKGGLGVKFERAVVSEIVGIHAAFGRKTSSRIDPLGVRKEAGPLYERQEAGHLRWTIDKSLARREKNEPVKLGKDGKPSEANHGNIAPSLSDAGGVTVLRADQTTVISFAALRRLRFPSNGVQSTERNLAGQTVLAALGLCSATLAAESGLDLRSRCLLWPNETPGWELLVKPGEIDDKLRLTAADATLLLKAAIESAGTVGLTWRNQPLRLRPSDDLVKLVVKSQKLAIESGGEE